MPKNKKNSMKSFWDKKAEENAPFYIATWRSYDKQDLGDFFLSPDDVRSYLTEPGCETGEGKRMLEIGCGIGRMTSGFAEHFSEVHAIDVSGEMIRQASANLAQHKNVMFYETDGESLENFPEEFFDFCFSFIVFQHLPAQEIIENYIKEAGRVLVDGGIFHFQVKGTPNPDEHTHPYVLKLKKIYRHFIRQPLLTLWRRLKQQPYGFESPAWIGTSMKISDIERTCTSSNLEIIRVVGEGTHYMWVTARKNLLTSKTG